jgi:type II secretory pathway pseudopilin PulG
VNGIDFVIVTALVLLVALAVAAGLQFAQDRAEAHLAAVSKEIRELQQEQHRNAPARYCATCGHELHPPI